MMSRSLPGLWRSVHPAARQVRRRRCPVRTFFESLEERYLLSHRPVEREAATNRAVPARPASRSM